MLCVCVGRFDFHLLCRAVVMDMLLFSQHCLVVKFSSHQKQSKKKKKLIIIRLRERKKRICFGLCEFEEASVLWYHCRLLLQAMCCFHNRYNINSVDG